MAFLDINKSGNSVEVVFNDYAPHPNIESVCRSYDIRDIVEIDLKYDLSHIIVTMRDARGIRVWAVTYDATYSGEDYFIISTVETAPPTDQHDLLNKLQALR